jgi:hypothetical protein
MQWEKPSPNLNPVAAFSFAILRAGGVVLM